jgi:hypothetical protein
MARRPVYHVAGLVFTTKPATLDHVHAIRDRYADGEALCPPDQAFMEAFFAHHPD